MKHRNQQRQVLGVISTLFMTISLASAADIQWSNAGTGAWTDGANWSTATAPTTADRAILSNGGTATIADPDSISIGTLRFSSGVLTMTGGTLAASPANGDATYLRIGDYGISSTVGTTSVNLSGNAAISSANRIYIADGNNNGNTGTAVANLTTANLTLSGTSSITANDSWLIVGRQGGNATVTLTENALLEKKGTGNALTIADGATNTVTTASLTMRDSSRILSSAEIYIGTGNAATGTLTIKDNATVTKTGITTSFITIGRTGSTGTVNVENSGKLISENSLRLAEAATANATLNLKDNATAQMGNYAEIGHQGTGVVNISDNAVFTATQHVSVGISGGKGSLIMTGGTLTANGTATGIVGGGNNGQATVTLSGTSAINAGALKWKSGDFGGPSNAGTATITLNDTSKLTLKQFTIGHIGGPTATETVSVNDNSTLTVNEFITIGRDDNVAKSGINSFLKLNGGTLATGYIIKGSDDSNAAKNNITINGSTIKALAEEPDFFKDSGRVSPADGRLYVQIQSGGLKFDTNGHNVGIQTILHEDAVSEGGGLTKLGAGTLTLSALNTYTGNTTVTEGVLVIEQANVLDDASTVTLASTGSLSLPNATTDVVESLVIGGVQQPAGFYTFGVGQLEVLTGGTADPFTEWANLKGLDGTPGKENGPLDDPDGDGKTNLAEFAFNGNPLDGADNGKVHVILADGDSPEDPSTASELILTVAVRSGALAFAGSPSPSVTVDGITYIIEGSLDLVDFTAPVREIGPVTTGLPDAGVGYEYRSFSLDASDGLTGKGFLRAKVTK